MKYTEICICKKTKCEGFKERENKPLFVGFTSTALPGESWRNQPLVPQADDPPTQRRPSTQVSQQQNLPLQNLRSTIQGPGGTKV